MASNGSDKTTAQSCEKGYASTGLRPEFMGVRPDFFPGLSPVMLEKIFSRV
jgi:hypothetical protein